MAIYSIKHWLRTKIYHAWLNIQEERNEMIILGIISNMKSIGSNPAVKPDSFFSGMQHMEIGNNFYCGKNAWVETIDRYQTQPFTPHLVIGDNFSMQYNCHIGCVECIEIGDNVLLGSKVYITDHFHGNITKEDIDVPPVKRPLSSRPVRIGNNVWIGDNVVIMPGVTLGNNVIVGANAVVTHSFPDNTVIAGCPAKAIKILE